MRRSVDRRTFQLVLGCVLVVLVMALPTGIVGTLARLTGKLRRDCSPVHPC